MPEKPLKDDKCENEEKDVLEKTPVSDDRKRRDYYYDDAHGYEDFDPDEAEEEDEGDET